MSSRELVARLLANPPLVHQHMDRAVVWNTEPECYEFLADKTHVGERTLETGLGVSTLVFACVGSAHACVTPSEHEVEALRRYCAEHAISLDGVTFEIGRSEDVLPNLAREELDLAFIDGGHAFPLPMLDWFYAAGRLRRGGTLVLDDLQLPAVAILNDFLSSDPRWERVAGTNKWTAYERTAQWDMGEWWGMQPFHHFPPAYDPLRQTVPRSLRKVLRDIARSVRRRAPRRQHRFHNSQVR